MKFLIIVILSLSITYIDRRRIKATYHEGSIVYSIRNFVILFLSMLMFSWCAENVFRQVGTLTSSHKLDAVVVENKLAERDMQDDLPVYETYVEFTDEQGNKLVKKLDFTASHPPKISEHLKIVYDKESGYARVANLGRNFFSTGVLVVQSVFMVALGLVIFSFILVAFTGKVALANKLTWRLFFTHVVSFVFIFFAVLSGSVLWMHFFYGRFSKGYFIFCAILFIVSVFALIGHFRRMKGQ